MANDDEGSWDFDDSPHPAPRSRAERAPATTAAPGPQDRPEAGAPSSDGVREPLGLLFAAGVCCLLSILIGVFSGWRPVWSLLGWLLGGLVAIGLVTWFSLLDTRRRADPYYLRSGLGSRVRRAVIVAAALAVALNAWHFADYVSRVRVL